MIEPSGPRKQKRKHSHIESPSEPSIRTDDLTDEDSSQQQTHQSTRRVSFSSDIEAPQSADEESKTSSPRKLKRRYSVDEYPSQPPFLPKAGSPRHLIPNPIVC